MLNQDLSVVAPELVLALLAMAGLMWGAYARSDVSRMVHWATVFVLVAVGFWVGFQPSETTTAFGDSFINDGFARFSKVMVLWGAAAALAMSLEYLIRTELLKYEFPVLILLATVGMMVMVSANDLIVLYLGLELQSLALYVVAAFRRDSVRSTEAGLKYFVLGSLSSGLLLYGASLVYGYGGTTAFAGIALVVAQPGPLPLGLVFGLVFLSAGIAFKVSAAPFHMWTPDVYEGSPTPVTAFFATAPKVAASAMFARVLFSAFGGAVPEWQQILAFLSLASMALGSVAAIGQTNIKRLMAYSSIGHMGYALMGLASGTVLGVESLLIYLAIYVVMSVGVFAFILNMEKDGQPVTEIASLGLYSRVEPARAAALAVLMFSLAGIPPLVGFFGKFYVLKAAIDAGLVWLAVAGMIASVVGAYYYLRIVYLMYFGQPVDGLNGRMPTLHWGLLGLSAIIMVVGIVNLFGVETLAASAAATLVP
ncbi:NADH-quinone oxidoreductase subunit NuoN [Amaricoccus solimangrovi]|uniref:NADH-quinone oxidoreductase subunit N n=1 Tax=Amaricoccus solimangrovi TaxID=2589815 RepID=A0A501WZJ6_9RHOB|nr:NADH-quinone oxidoreductase subunit NuoN [Amaricoccus solimangrovi]TPE53884.1 NADH-quinone oxidoreductase subunit NuoN [Amaricoccus solimangrovi]